jgi:hypothetical protein
MKSKNIDLTSDDFVQLLTLAEELIKIASAFVETLKTVPNPKASATPLINVNIGIDKAAWINGECISQGIGRLLKYAAIQRLDNENEWSALWAYVLIPQSNRPDRTAKYIFQLNTKLDSVLGKGRLRIMTKKGSWNHGLNDLPQCSLQVDSNIKIQGPPIEAIQILDGLKRPLDRNELLKTGKQCVQSISLYPYSIKPYIWLDQNITDKSIQHELEPTLDQRLFNQIQEMSLWLGDLQACCTSPRIEKRLRSLVRQTCLEEITARQKLVQRVKRILLGSATSSPRSTNPLNVIIHQIAQGAFLKVVVESLTKDEHEILLDLREMAIANLEEMLGKDFGTYDDSELRQCLDRTLIELARDKNYCFPESNTPNWKQASAGMWAKMAFQSGSGFSPKDII